MQSQLSQRRQETFYHKLWPHIAHLAMKKILYVVKEWLYNYELILLLSEHYNKGHIECLDILRSYEAYEGIRRWKILSPPPLISFLNWKIKFNVPWHYLRKYGIWTLLNQFPIIAVFPIERFPGDPNTALTGEPL